MEKLVLGRCVNPARPFQGTLGGDWAALPAAGRLLLVKWPESWSGGLPPDPAGMLLLS